MIFSRKIAINIILIIYLLVIACNQDSSNLTCNVNTDHSEAIVYKPCHEFIFRSKYWSEGELISDEKISLFITGNGWQYDSSQAEALLLYKADYSESSVNKIKSFGINPEINDRPWVSESATGIIDNEKTMFLHPFRHNQYYFTEIAPFPQVIYPLHVGKAWSAALNIGGGWGIWDGIRLETAYRVVNKESLTINGNEYNNCWKISSSATSEVGISYLTMWFHEEFGFVKFNYVIYSGQILQIELDRLIEH
ncbi:MAG: hypothetical protein AAF149_15685 [Bacteroidota bacterium]